MLCNSGTVRYLRRALTQRTVGGQSGQGGRGGQSGRSGRAAALDLASTRPHKIHPADLELLLPIQLGTSCCFCHLCDFFNIVICGETLPFPNNYSNCLALYVLQPLPPSPQVHPTNPDPPERPLWNPVEIWQLRVP